MSDSRYTPPAATVADVESSVESLERPRIVTQGIWLLWVYLVIGVLQVIVEGLVAFTPIEDDPDGVSRKYQLIGTVVTLVVIVVMVLLTWFAWMGRNWARITHLVLMILGMLMYGLSILASYWFVPGQEIFTDEWYLTLLFALETVLSVAGVLMLFAPSANAWYRSMRAARARSHFTG